MTERQIIVVLGMHRSGTSLLASILSALSFPLGQNLYPPDTHNPAGYFEDRECMSIQEQILEELGQPWHGEKGMLPFPPFWWKEERIRPLVQKLEAWLDRRLAEEDSSWAFKDPRTTRFLGLWRELFAARNIVPRYVLAIRDPAEVVASELHRDDVPASRIYHTWLRYNLEALLYSGSHLIAVVDYSRWFIHGDAQMTTLGSALGIQLQSERIREILDSTLRSDLHRQDGSNQLPPPWARKVYESLLALTERTAQNSLCFGDILAEAEYCDALLRQGKIPDFEGLLTAIVASPQTIEAYVSKAVMLAGSGRRIVLSLPAGSTSQQPVAGIAVLEREAHWPAVQGSPFAKAAFEAYRWLRQRSYDALFFPGGEGLATISLDARQQGYFWSHGPVYIDYFARPDWLLSGGVLEVTHFSAAEASCLDRRAFFQADHLLCEDSTLLEDLRKLANECTHHAANSAAAHSMDLIQDDNEGEPPLVSVCITHYNRPDCLRYCLDSVRAQSYSRIEVVLVDDGSDDPAVKPLLDDLQSEFQSKSWRLIRQENRYLGAARNAAAQAAEGEYLFILDDDNLLLPDAITRVVGVAEHSRADIVTSTLRLFSDIPEAISFEIMPLWVFPGACPLLGIFENCYGDASALVRRVCWKALGGFAEDRNVGHEDWEFFARAVLSGWALEHNPEPVLCYRVDPKAMARSGDWEQNYRRGLRPYAALLPSPLATLPTLAGHLQRAQLTEAAEKEAVRSSLVRAEQELAGLAGDLYARENEIADLTGDLYARENEIADLTEDLCARENDITDLTGLLHARENDIADLTGLLHVRENKIAVLTNENASLSFEINLTQSSLSWRLTKPMRSIAHIGRRIVKKPAVGRALVKEYRIVKNSRLFEHAFYEFTYSDISANGIDPILHYCRYGWLEGRNPSPHFDTNFYLNAYADVKASGMNPLVHYIKFGQAEGRSTNPNGAGPMSLGKDKQLLKIVKLIRRNPALVKRFVVEARRHGIKSTIKKTLAASQRIAYESGSCRYNIHTLWDLFSLSPELPSRKIDETIDIVIPVFNGRKYLESLFASIIKNTTSPYRLLIADDKSTDPTVRPYLYKIKADNPVKDIVIIENDENLGFIKTVNKLAAMTRGHFVLLNTDVEVPAQWLERLVTPLYEMENVASLTPFTNAGTICSFPTYLQDNELPEGMDVDALDRAFRFVKWRENIISIPTGVGFCMAINKMVWNRIGGFDEIFGKGYGEENDWCMRAAKLGYKNLHLPNLFVYHKHGGSFSPEDKVRYQEKNLAILNQRYPDYSSKVQQLIAADTYSPLRNYVLTKALCDQFGATAIFDHDLGGGASQFLEQYKKETHRKVAMLIRYNTISGEFSVSFVRDQEVKASISCAKPAELRDMLGFFNVDELVVNNLVSYPNLLDFIDFLCELAAGKMRLTYMMHDYYAVCPMYNLIDYKMKYCGVPEDHEFCATCLKKNPLLREQVPYFVEEYSKLTIGEWRSHFRRLLTVADNIRFFSRSSQLIVEKAYPELDPDKQEFKPHKVTWVRPIDARAPGNFINIGIIGVMTFTKGIHVISAFAGYIEAHRLNYKLHIFGRVTDPQISLEKFASVRLHGQYKKEDLPWLMQREHIDILWIPSIWPETFSYTTEEAIGMGLPVAVFDLGAPAERVRNYARGIILADPSPEAIDATIAAYFGRLPNPPASPRGKPADAIVFVCVSNNEHMYQRCVGSSFFMTEHRIIKYDNSEKNVPLPIHYNHAIDDLLGTGYHGWIFFIHNDFSIMENLQPIVEQLDKEAVYGPIGAVLEKGRKRLYGEIQQGHDKGLITHGQSIEQPIPVDTVDCQCIFLHTDILRNYALRFEEATPLAFHQYAEDFCLTAKEKAGLQTYAVQLNCKHLSWGRIDAAFERAIRFIEHKHAGRKWAGTCTHLDQG